MEILKRLSVLFFSLGLFVSIANAAPPLPRWIDKERELPVFSYLPTPEKETPPPAESFKIPPEYAPVRAVVIGYDALYDILNQIMQGAYEEGHAQVWAANLDSVNFPIHPNLLYTSGCPINSSWIRDYGPFGITSNGMLGLVDTRYSNYRSRINDDNFPTCLANEMGIPSYGTNLILDGGNVMVDSQGTLFMTRVTYLNNPGLFEEEVDELIKSYFGVKNIVAVDYAGYPNEPEDGTGHIDMFLKLIDDNTFVLAETEDEPYKSTFERVYQQLQSLTAPNGKPYKIVRLPGWVDWNTWYTYTNSLIVNGILLMPDYAGHEEETQLAIERYKEASEGNELRIFPINTDDSIILGGSIHCLTQTIPYV